MTNNLKIAGIVCEFNPLHFGHEYIIKKAKNLGTVVCIMSGNYVQRGETAIIDKWSRAELALKSGANLVLELASPYSMSGAEHFASASIFALSTLGFPGYVVFGSECGDDKLLTETASLLLKSDFEIEMTKALEKSSVSYAKTREEVIKKLYGAQYAEVLRSPNNILAVEYIKASTKQGSALTPYTVTRKGSAHDTVSCSNIKSAQEIRSMILSDENIKPYLPDTTYNVIQQQKLSGKISQISALETAILCKLRTMNSEDFSKIPDVSEGLEYKIVNSIKTAGSLETLYKDIKSKRYTHARIRRILLNAFLDITNAIPYFPKYIRVLGMDKAGEEIIKTARPEVPLCIRAKDIDTAPVMVKNLFQQESIRDDIYGLSQSIPSHTGTYYTTRLVKI